MFNMLTVGAIQNLTNEERQYYFPGLDRLAPDALQDKTYQNVIAAADKPGATLADLITIITDGWKNDDIYQTAAAMRVDHPHMDALNKMLNRGDYMAGATGLKQLLDQSQEITKTVGKLYFSMVAHMITGQDTEAMSTARDFLRIVMMARHLNSGGPAKFPKDDNLPVTEHSRYVPFVKDYHIKADPQIGFRLPPHATPKWTGNAAPIGDDIPTSAPPSTRIADLTAAIRELDQHERQQQAQRRSAAPTNEQMERLRLAGSDDEADNPKDAFEQQTRAHETALLTSQDRKTLSATTQSLIAETANAKASALPLNFVQEELEIALNSAKADTPTLRATQTATYVAGLMLEPKHTLKSDVFCGPTELPCHCDLLMELDAKHAGKPQLSILGIGDHHIIKSERIEYVRGDLVHTEPVLGGTVKTTDFRTLDRTESFSETFESSTREEEKESKTEDRFKMEAELESQLETEKSQEFGVSITAGFGPVSVSANYGQTSNTATRDKTRTARTQAQDRMTRALTKIRTQTDKTSSVRKIAETERSAGFTLDNAGNSSFTGFYHAIDQRWSHQLMCVGKKLMVRVSLQQPMAFLKHCMASGGTAGVTLDRPIAPDEWKNEDGNVLTNFNQINAQNYDRWAAAFDVTDVSPPPQSKTATEQLNGTIGNDSWSSTGGKISLPAGYAAKAAKVNIQMSGGSGRYVSLAVSHASSQWVSSTGILHYTLSDEIDEVAYSVRGNTGSDYTINLVVICRATQDTLDKWKMSVFNAIWAEYTRKKSSYDNAVQAAAIEEGIKIQGRNPGANENMIRQELMKLVIGATAPSVYYRGFSSMKFGEVCGEGASGVLVPEPDFAQAHEDSELITFLCQLYDWKNITYAFKPYFFGNRSDWCDLRQVADVDPKFEAAMSAGQVVVDIPVSDAMVPAFFHFINTGEPYNGNGTPLIGDPLYQSVALEIMGAQTSDAEPCGDPWETIVPTSLVMVDDTPPASL